MTETFEQYLIEVGIKSSGFSISKITIMQSVEYFRKCWKQKVSAYRALIYVNTPDELHRCDHPHTRYDLPTGGMRCVKCKRLTDF
jgi:hypothetical protein